MPLEQVRVWRTSDGQIFENESEAEREQFYIDIVNTTQGELQDREAINLLWCYRTAIFTILRLVLPKTSDRNPLEF